MVELITITVSISLALIVRSECDNVLQAVGITIADSLQMMYPEERVTRSADE